MVVLSLGASCSCILSENGVRLRWWFPSSWTEASVPFIPDTTLPKTVKSVEGKLVSQPSALHPSFRFLATASRQTLPFVLPPTGSVSCSLQIDRPSPRSLIVNRSASSHAFHTTRFTPFVCIALRAVRADSVSQLTSFQHLLTLTAAARCLAHRQLDLATVLGMAPSSRDRCCFANREGQIHRNVFPCRFPLTSSNPACELSCFSSFPSFASGFGIVRLAQCFVRLPGELSSNSLRCLLFQPLRFSHASGAASFTRSWVSAKLPVLLIGGGLRSFGYSSLLRLGQVLATKGPFVRFSGSSASPSSKY